VPGPLSRPAGCSFADRCPFATARCRAAAPTLRELDDAHLVACWRAPLEVDALLAEPAEPVPAT
jgi:ABC-type dipeptide/oligopeptide/nickel transport system ATPase component